MDQLLWLTIPKPHLGSFIYQARSNTPDHRWRCWILPQCTTTTPPKEFKGPWNSSQIDSHLLIFFFSWLFFLFGQNKFIHSYSNSIHFKCYFDLNWYKSNFNWKHWNFGLLFYDLNLHLFNCDVKTCAWITLKRNWSFEGHHRLQSLREPRKPHPDSFFCWLHTHKHIQGL